MLQKVGGQAGEVGREESLDPCQTVDFMPHLAHGGESFENFKQGNDMVAESFLKINLGSMENRCEGIDLSWENQVHGDCYRRRDKA